jgi:hypothetical protein
VPDLEHEVVEKQTAWETPHLVTHHCSHLTVRPFLLTHFYLEALETAVDPN